MFERGSSERAVGRTPVELTLEDGRLLAGRLLVPKGDTLGQALNNPARFIEFELTGGERTFIAKSALLAVKPIDVPPAPELRAGPTEGSDFDPVKVLGVQAGASPQEIREAYLRLSKIYHPDRYAAAELPAEVRSYLAVMARRINAAHQALQAAQKPRMSAPDPVFTKESIG